MSESGWWDRAVAEFAEHLNADDVACSFGGMSMAGWYWLADDSCTRPHGDQCAGCGTADGVMPLRWRGGQRPTDEQYPDIEMWEIPVCSACVPSWATRSA